MNLPLISVNRPVFISSIVIFLFFSGIVSLYKLPVSLFPDAVVPFISVTTVYPGAGPNEVESSISRKLEDELSSLEGLKKINTISQDAVSLIWLEFNSGISLDSAEQRVRDKVAIAQTVFPKDVNLPLIERFSPSQQPIVTVFASSDTQSLIELTTWSDRVLKPMIARIPKVGKVEIVGGRKRQINVVADPDKLSRYRIPLLQVSDSLSKGGAHIPGGSLSVDGQEIGVRTLGLYDSLERIREKIVSFGNGESPIRVKDISDVIDASEKPKTSASSNKKNGLVIQVYKQSGANSVQVADDIKRFLEKENTFFKQEKIDLRLVKDGARLVRESVYDVWESIVIGFFLTFIVVFMFLGSLRSTLITGFAIPNSLLGCFLFMYFFGFSVNILTLLALSLCVGLVVDDAIVVRENIFKKIEQGLDAKQAAVIGANEVGLAVLATSAAVIAMFGPVGFLTGVTGQYFKEFGLVICFAMVISVFDGMAVAPMLSAVWSESHQVFKDKKNWIDTALRKFHQALDLLQKKYQVLLLYVVHRKGMVITSIIGVASVLSCSVLFLPSSFLPTDQSSDFYVRVQLPVGQSLKSTEIFTGAVEEKIKSHPSVLETLVLVGNSQQETHKAEIYVKLRPQNERKGFRSSQVREMLQRDFDLWRNNPDKAIFNAEIRVVQNDVSGSGMRPLSVLVQAKSREDVKSIATKVFDSLRGNPKVLSPELELQDGKKEIQIQFRDANVQRFGVDPFQAGMEIRGRIEGNDVGRFNDNGVEFPIKVMSRDSSKDWMFAKESRVLVPNLNMNPVPLAQVALYKMARAPSRIERVNRSFAIRITGDLAEGASLPEIMTEIDQVLLKASSQMSGVSRLYEGDAESYDELSKSMALAFSFGIVVLFLVLASLYESFFLSALNLVSLPLAVSGAFAGLWVFGESLNIYSIMGVLLLLGVATKNSILLIDSTKSFLDKTHSSYGVIEELIQSSVSRFRPILMTSFALAAGTIPIAIGLNEASAMRTGMGVAIIGGIFTSTLFTLVFIPAILALIASRGPSGSLFCAPPTGLE